MSPHRSHRTHRLPGARTAVLRAPGPPAAGRSWRPPARSLLAGLLGLTAGLAGCTASAPAGPRGPAWRRATLPAARTGTIALHDVAACPGRWYAVGGYLGPGGSTAPAAWTSADGGHTWTALATTPVSAYGPQHVLTAVACQGDTVVAVGQVSGGAHGNNRIGTWIRHGNGPLTEVPAAFELYGGPDQVGTGRVAGGPAGWVIEGGRVDANGAAGAAAWAAPDGAAFELVDADPDLESDSRGQTSAGDVLATPDGFTMAGALVPAGRAVRVPLAWASPNGRSWRRQAVPDAGGGSLDRLAGYRGGLLAAGTQGGGFGTWRESGGSWQVAGRFGTVAGPGLAQVTGLAVAGTAAYLTLTDGSRYQLWTSSDGTGWVRLELPAAVPAGLGHQVTVAGTGGHLLLIEDAALYLG